MKLITIPPYKALNYTPERGRFVELELIDNMRKRGQLDGIEVDVDDGHDLGHRNVARDQEFSDQIGLGVLGQVKLYCDSGQYDGIVCVGSILGMSAARMVSKIPLVSTVHSGYHVASLIGDRFSVIEATDPQALIARHFAELYGFNHKLASVRTMSHSSTSMTQMIRDHKKEERKEIPEFKAFIDDLVTQSAKAIEEDGADSIILSCTPIQCFEEEIREALDASGYDEIQLVCQYSAAVEMVKAMVNLKLVQSPRAYPGDSLKAKPQFR